MLHAEVDGRGPRVVLVHGFSQNRNCWGPIATDLARDHEVVRVDAPGHGRSSPFYAGLRTGARLIADQGGTATYVGYSMGARFVLHLALANPELVQRLVLIGATAGIDDPDARAERKKNDEAMALRLERDGLEPFLDAWLAQPLFAGLSDEMQFRAERLENTVDGLAESLRQAGTGSQDPLWDRLARIDVPTLVVAGADDTKFSAEARRLVDAIGANASVAIVEGAGHAAHLERPDEVLVVLRQWLTEHDL
ncbi:MAG: 2-succinyl-6-hydroxy-2,4-cyclohexadiene-carboxylate synthase [Acidimicrobiaceae bacterium]|jgi:2-succinyl-6-hydroxy-2,4-cyclohexadiene-1-carboxylate synthase